MPFLFRQILRCVAALTALSALPVAAAVPTGGFEIRHIHPHDATAFTEGLFYLHGDLFESTGIPGQSNIRRVRLNDGAVLQSRAIGPGALPAVASA